MTQAKPSSSDQFNVRFPPGMRDMIATSAKQHGRSMNSEIVARLQSSLGTDEAIVALADAENSGDETIRVAKIIEALKLQVAKQSEQLAVLSKFIEDRKATAEQAGAAEEDIQIHPGDSVI